MAGKQGGKKLPKRTGKRHTKHQACWEKNQQQKKNPNAVQCAAHKRNVELKEKGVATPWEISKMWRYANRLHLHWHES